MRRLMAFFLLISMFLLPVFASCVPSGYEEGTENPNKPPGLGGTSTTDDTTQPAPPPADDSSSSDDSGQ
ncbi:MAG: hypothetical protein NTY09_03715 [bacterium]|nr:hypothetical protein [bacterium]